MKTFSMSYVFAFACLILPTLLFADPIRMYDYKRVPLESANSYRSFSTALFNLGLPFMVEESQVESIFQAIDTYLDDGDNIFRSKVKKRFPQSYSFQLLGFVSKGKEVILINAYLKDGKRKEIPDTAYFAFDGGCGYVRMYYLVEKGKVIDLECNGEA